jgi:CHAT domain-containing protein/tetratricopeptide (TPR) repeat protein
VIVIDVSMSTIDPYRRHGWPTASRANPPEGSILDAELAAAVDFLEGSDPQRVAVAVVAFAGEPPSESGSPSSSPPAWVEVPLTTDYSLVRAGLERLRERGASGSSHLAAAVDQATIELLRLRGASSEPRPQSVKAAFLLTDGVPTLPYGPGFESDNVEAVRRALDRSRRAGIQVHLFALGPDAETLVALKEPVSATQGMLFTVREKADLAPAVISVGRRLSGVLPVDLVRQADAMLQNGRFVSARTLARRAIAELEAHEDEPSQLEEARSILAAAEFNLGDYSRAGETLRLVFDAQQRSRADAAQQAITLSSMIWVELARGRVEEANRLASQALSLVDAARRSLVARAYVLRADELAEPEPSGVFLAAANARMVAGRLAEADDLLSESLELARTEEDSGTEASTLLSRGLLQLARGDEAAATTSLEQSIELGYAPLLGHNYLAYIRLKHGDLAGGAASLEARNAILDRHDAVDLSEGTERDWRERTAPIDDVAGFTTMHLLLTGENAEAGALILGSVLRRKGRLYEKTLLNRASFGSGEKGANEPLLQRLADLRSRRAALEFAAIEAERDDVTHREQAVLEEEMTTIELELSSRAGAWAECAARDACEGSGPRDVSAAILQSRVPAGHALIEYFWYRPFIPEKREELWWADRWGEPRYGACVIKRKGPVACRDLADVESIERRVGEFVRSMGARAALHEVTGRSASLHRDLFAPLRPLLGDATNLIVAPDGALHLLPFSALVDEEGDYLIRRYTISYSGTGRELLLVRARAARTEPIILGDPDFSVVEAAEGALRPASAANGIFEFARLPGTRAEAEQINQLLPGSRLLLEAQASETALKAAHSPTVLHVATHAFFLPTRGQDERSRQIRVGGRGVMLGLEPASDPLLKSGLALAGANARSGRADDGILTALEAASLDLAGTELVVLSACETGLGEPRVSEGVYGLRRAFATAGARTVVSSFWKVDDAATTRLMLAFYRQVIEDRPRASALRSAQLSLLDEPTLAHPFYWAAFAPYGEWGPLSLR